MEKSEEVKNNENYTKDQEDEEIDCNTRTENRTKKKEEVPNFLLKLYKILENNEFQNIINWSEDGTYFIIHNLHEFTEKVLPKYYKHNNYSSFIRNLNMYDFHKKKGIKNSHSNHVFEHKNFLKGKKELIKTIKRKSIKNNTGNNNNNNMIDLDENRETNECVINNKEQSLIKYKGNGYLTNITPNVNPNITNMNCIQNSQDKNIDNANTLVNINRPFQCNTAVNNNSIKEEANIENNKNQINEINNIKNNQEKKVTKKSLENLLVTLIKKVEQNKERQKDLESKIEKLSKQNEEFLIENQKMLNEVISKTDYNKKLEAVVCFILEMIMNKPKMKGSNDIKNMLITNDMNKNLPEFSIDVNKLETANLNSPKNEISQLNRVLPPNDFLQKKTLSSCIDHFQAFYNKYLERSKNNNLLGKAEISPDQNTINAIKGNNEAFNNLLTEGVNSLNYIANKKQNLNNKPILMLNSTGNNENNNTNYNNTNYNNTNYNNNYNNNQCNAMPLSPISIQKRNRISSISSVNSNGSNININFGDDFIKGNNNNYNKQPLFYRNKQDENSMSMNNKFNNTSFLNNNANNNDDLMNGSNNNPLDLTILSNSSNKNNIFDLDFNQDDNKGIKDSLNCSFFNPDNNLNNSMQSDKMNFEENKYNGSFDEGNL